MRKIFAIVILVLGFSGAWAENYRGQLFYVKGFYPSTKKVKDNLLQKNTRYNNACGITSLLFVNNYISYRANGIVPTFLETKSGAISALNRLYDYLGKSHNSIASFYDLKKIAKNRWRWNHVKRRPANNACTIQQNNKGLTDSISCNIDNLILDLKNDMLALVVLDSSFPRNPTRNNYSIDHIVIAYAYQKRKGEDGLPASSNDPNRDNSNDRIYFYDPYYGKVNYFKVSEIPQYINLTGFSYLRVSP